MKILVLGGCGRQGSIIAEDLSRNYNVTVADVSCSAQIQEDLSSYAVLKKMIPKYNLIVGALPSALGLNAIMAAIDSGVNYVDLSFMEHDVASFNGGAMHKRITVLHDCGVAPGLSHLVAGRAIHAGADEIEIYVGGVAAESKKDYVITWSTDDLIEEYTRPARIIIDGKQKTLGALSDCVEVKTSLGVMEAFYSDGLRSLLSKKSEVNRMIEKTLRWPGHVDKIKPALGAKNPSNEIMDMYPDTGKDVLILKVVARWSKQNITRTAELVVRSDDKMSAMARSTALSCSAFAQLLATGNYNRTGVIPPEDVAKDDLAYKFVLDCMSERNIEFNNKYPFMEVHK